MHFENSFATDHIWFINGNLSVETAWAEQGWIQYVRPVGSSYDNNTGVGSKTVHFHQQRVKCILTLVIGTWHSATSAGATYCIDLINKNDTGCFFFGLLEKVTDTRRTDPNKHFDKVRTGQ